MSEPSRAKDAAPDNFGTFRHPHDLPEPEASTSRSDPHCPPAPQVAYAFPERTAKRTFAARCWSQSGSGPATVAPSSMRFTKVGGRLNAGAKPSARLPSTRNCRLGKPGFCKEKG